MYNLMSFNLNISLPIFGRVAKGRWTWALKNESDVNHATWLLKKLESTDGESATIKSSYSGITGTIIVKIEKV